MANSAPGPVLAAPAAEAAERERRAAVHGVVATACAEFTAIQARVVETLERSARLRASLVARRPPSMTVGQLFHRTRQELAELQRLVDELDALGRADVPVGGPPPDRDASDCPDLPTGTAPTREPPAATRERLRRLRLALATNYDLLAATLASTARDQPAHAARLRVLAAGARRAADSARRHAGSSPPDGNGSGEGLLQIGKQVVGVLDADREAHQVAGHLQG